ADQGEVRAINQRHPIEQEKLLRHAARLTQAVRKPNPKSASSWREKNCSPHLSHAKELIFVEWNNANPANSICSNVRRRHRLRIIAPGFQIARDLETPGGVGRGAQFQFELPLANRVNQDG